MVHSGREKATHSAAPAVWLAAAITLAGAFLRFFLLNRYPVGFYFDEAANLFDIFGLGPSFHPIYFPNNNGREPFFFYWAAIFVRPLLVSPYALRVAAAFLGVATVPAVYFCISQMLRKAEGAQRDRRVAMFSSVVCAVLLFHVIFSRTGLRTISLPLFECLAFGLLWQAARLRSAWRFVLGGVLLGATLYTYTAARLLVAGVLVYAAYCLLFQRKSLYWRGAALAVAGGIVTAVPLAVYAAAYPAYFFQRTEGVAITDLATAGRNALAILAMFNLHGTDEALQNIPGLPVFDPVMGLLFLVGAVLCLSRLSRAPYVFALIWLVSIIPASAFSPRAPYYLRLTGLIPPAVFLAGLGLAHLPELLRRFRWAYVPSIAVVLASGAVTFHNYFQAWGDSGEAFYALMQDKVDGAAQVRSWIAAGDQVFLAPLYAQDWTYRFLTRGWPIQSFEARDCTPLPPAGQAVTYVYPFFDREQPPLLLSHLGGNSRVEEAPNSRGEPNLIAIRLVPAPPSGQALASFGGQIALESVVAPTGVLKPGESIQLTLAWRALRQMDTDYTVFVHVDENVSHRRIQRDSMPCGASFGTSHWTPGERVLDYYSLPVPADAPDGAYTVTVGLYKAPELRNLQIDGRDGSELEVGTIRIAR